MAKLFVEALSYRHLGDCAERADNSNIEEGLLSAYRSGTKSEITDVMKRIRF